MTFEDVLQQLQPEEMKDFLRHYRENSPDFEQRFLVFFSHKNPDSHVEKLTQQLVLQFFKQHSEKGYRLAVDKLALSVISLYDRRPAMLEEMRRALQYKSL